jgi:transposase
MRQATKYVFLDVHQATTVGAIREENGRVIATPILPTDAGALMEFFRGMRGTVHVALEEGTQAQWLSELLTPVVHRVLVCDRRGERRRGNKCDKLDALEGSELLRRGALRAVYHGGPQGVTLKELAQTYQNLVDDTTRVKQRLKATFRGRGIPTKTCALYRLSHQSEWIAKLPNRGLQWRAEMLYEQLELFRTLRARAKTRLVTEAQREKAWPWLRSIPYLGPIRVSLLLAVVQTPWRFRTKRNLWSYAGLAVVIRSTNDFALVDGQPVRRRRTAVTRGLNQNHNRVLKNVFRSAANGATGRPGPLQDFYKGMIERGMRPERARITLARKLAALTLRLWKKGERFDPTKLTLQAS